MIRKVLILVPNDTLGGAEQYLKNIASNMLSEGYELNIFFLKKEGTKAWRDLNGSVNFFFTNSEKERSGVIACLIKLFSNRDASYDYVFTSHVHLNSLVGMLISFGIIKKKFFIGRESTSIFKRFTGLKLLMFKLFYVLGYNKLNLLICQTEFMKQQLVEGMPKLASKINIQVIPNPINLDNIKIAEDINFNLKTQNYIVSAGRLIPEKGFDILIRAFARIKDIFPDLNLVILGEGGERVKLELLTKELEVFERVQLVGFQDNVYTYFKYAKACVVSSRIEGFPNVLLQMMSQNNSIISTLCAGGIDEIPAIYTCEPNDYSQLANRIEKLLTTENSCNRKVFDNFLAKRSVPAFVEQINTYLNV